jgi:hypothetical protein
LKPVPPPADPEMSSPTVLKITSPPPVSGVQNRGGKGGADR